MASYKALRKFSPDELVLTEEETIIVLKFIFKNQHSAIDTLPMSDALRGFAQGLLVEAIDATYAMGFIEALVKSAKSSANTPKKLLKNFGKKAAKHWFEHATRRDLMEAEIYDVVILALDRAFTYRLAEFTSLSSLEGKIFGALIDYRGVLRSLGVRYA